MTTDAEIFTVLFFVFGLVLGSFGNVVIARLPKDRTLRGRSACIKCKKTLGAWELIPVVSFLFLNGRCAKCRKKISWQYPFVELASAILFVTAFALTSFHPVPAFILGFAFWAMLLIAVIDAKTQTIPDVLTLVVAVAAVVFQLLSDGSVPLIAPLIGVAFFGVQWIVSKGKWVGSGDIFLAAALGLLLGTWQQMVVSLMVAYISGMVVALILIARKKAEGNSHVAFGPFLIGGAFVALVFGEQIVQAVFMGMPIL